MTVTSKNDKVMAVVLVSAVCSHGLSEYLHVSRASYHPEHKLTRQDGIVSVCQHPSAAEGTEGTQMWPADGQLS